MRKRLSVILSAIASVILIFILLFTAVQVGINDNTFINNEYTKLGVAKQMGMSNADLVTSCIRLIDYMQGHADSLDLEVKVNDETVQMFDQEQEITHMADVRTLFLTCKQYRDFGLLAMLILFLLSAVLSFRSALHSIAKGYLWGAFLMFLVIGFVGTWAALDFSSFWTAFHQALFWNELWLFDPATSRMINMLPEQFFQDLVTRIVLYAGAAIVLLIAAAVFTLVSLRRREEKAREKRRQAGAVAASKKRKAQPHAEKTGAHPALTEEERRARAKAKKRRAPSEPESAEEADAEDALPEAAEAPARRKKRPAAEVPEAPAKKKKRRPTETTPAKRRKAPMEADRSGKRAAPGGTAKRRRPAADDPTQRLRRPRPIPEEPLPIEDEAMQEPWRVAPGAAEEPDTTTENQ